MEQSPPRKKIRAFFGLGNPESKYRNTYHNIGFLCLNELFQELTKKNELFEKVADQYNNFLLFQEENNYFGTSTLYMNESGRAITSFLRTTKVQTSELLVIHDDSDISTGTFKLSFGRGHAGHNGIKSISNSLNTKNFWRLRIGARNMETKKNIPASKFILSQITETDLHSIQEATTKAIASLKNSYLIY